MSSATNFRPTWAEIDLSSVKYNLRSVRSLIKPGTGVMAVVKANAYGHGISRVSGMLVDQGVDYLGVATVDEAMKLRKDGFRVPILVLGSVLAGEAKAAVREDITLTLCDRDLLMVLKKAASASGKPARVHVKIDTGMGRIGVWHEDAMPFIREAFPVKGVEVEGVYTHFSSAGRDKVMTRMQIAAFEGILGEMRSAGMEARYRHAANSIAVVDWKRSHMNLVRPGIVIYGVYPKESFRRSFSLRPVMRLKTRIVFLKDAPPGRSISYGRTYITQKHTKIATIPIGYADGYGRILSNKARALVRGRFVRVAGMVTMDQTLLDVGNIGDIRVGDEVVLIGSQGSSSISVEKIAKLSGTIPYEILSNITDRVPRVYL